MVGAVVARLGMGEDGEAGAIEREQLRDIAELLGRHGQLDAAARMRADGPEMEMADCDPEARLDRGGERLGLLDVLGIVIDVGVEIADGGWSWPGYSASI